MRRQCDCTRRSLAGLLVLVLVLGAVGYWEFRQPAEQAARLPQTSDVAAHRPPAKQTTEHWSFQPLLRPKVPPVQNAAWVRNPIDSFVLALLEAEKIPPSLEADGTTLIRRLSLDLRGLPPTPAEIEMFLADGSLIAYERLVDRLLASPQYGEKWARHWLDLARYADSDGFEKDPVRPHAWRYRHWVINALNDDLPFDQFTLEQIAGDLLPGATREQKVATGFHRNALVNREGGVPLEQSRFEKIVDRTTTVATVWLGLTFHCARCHDHKYDPITQREFYELFAFLNTTEDVDIDAPLPDELQPFQERRAEFLQKRAELFERYDVPRLKTEWEQLLRSTREHPGRYTARDIHLNRFRLYVDNVDKILDKPIEQRTFHEDDAFFKFFLGYFRDVQPNLEWSKLNFPDLWDELTDLEAVYPALSRAQTIRADPQAPESYVYHRGEFNRPGAKVTPGTPRVLHPSPADEFPDRSTLARWILSQENPLTPRVIVNRMWQEFFGQGIVRTTDDFGIQGAEPTHPKLLDWLAVEFRETGWSMKRIHKQIVMSSAYRQSSRLRPELSQRDPYNALIARQSRLRLSAECIRDVALASSGLLDCVIGGESIFPHQPESVADLGYGYKIHWINSLAPERHRRGLYIHFQRTVPYPMLASFDAPDSSRSCSRRERSNTPLQALILLNDPVFFEAAQTLAARIFQEASAGFDARLNQMFRLCLARKPTPFERDEFQKYYQQQQELFQREPGSAKAISARIIADMRPPEKAAWVGIARVMMNLDEFITRE